MPGRDRHVGRRVAELAAAPVAAHHDAAHGERSAERLGGTRDVAGGEAGADVGRRPHLRPAVERRPLDNEPARVAGLAQRGDVTGGPAAEAEVGAHDDDSRRAALRPAPGRRTPPGTRPRSRGRTAARRRASTPASASRAARVSREVSVEGACSGRSTAIGCGSKVTATSIDARRWSAISRARPITALVAEVDAVEVADDDDRGAESSGTSSRERQTCTATLRDC